ncbi:MAG: hypothetical protein IJW43_04435 [Clostridia bacterium]|nr:hypothetical protein [Clostridia bacterium]
MKNQTDEIMRVERVINNDRLKIKEEFSRLLEKDLTCLLQEYFYLSSSPQVQIVKKGKGYGVSIEFDCSNLKSFINIPN